MVVHGLGRKQYVVGPRDIGAFFMAWSRRHQRHGMSIVDEVQRGGDSSHGSIFEKRSALRRKLGIVVGTT